MGELAEDFAFMKEQKAIERAEKEPSRFDYAVQKLMDAGHRVGRDGEDDKALVVNGYIKFWPYTGWYSGKGIGSGRGIHELIKKLGQSHADDVEKQIDHLLSILVAKTAVAKQIRTDNKNKAETKAALLRIVTEARIAELEKAYRAVLYDHEDRKLNAQMFMEDRIAELKRSIEQKEQ